GPGHLAPAARDRRPDPQPAGAAGVLVPAVPSAWPVHRAHRRPAGPGPCLPASFLVALVRAGLSARPPPPRAPGLEVPAPRPLPLLGRRVRGGGGRGRPPGGRAGAGPGGPDPGAGPGARPQTCPAFPPPVVRPARRVLHRRPAGPPGRRGALHATGAPGG